MGEVDSGPGLTPPERAVLDALSQAWDEYLGLPSYHPDDVDEFRKALHDAQNLIAYRVARRVDPDVWGRVYDPAKPVIERTVIIDEITSLSPEDLRLVAVEPLDVGRVARIAGPRMPDLPQGARE